MLASASVPAGLGPVEEPPPECHLLAGLVADAVVLKVHSRLKRIEDNLDCLVARSPMDVGQAVAPPDLQVQLQPRSPHANRASMDDILARQDLLYADALQSLNYQLGKHSGGGCGQAQHVPACHSWPQHLAEAGEEVKLPCEISEISGPAALQNSGHSPTQALQILSEQSGQAKDEDPTVPPTGTVQRTHAENVKLVQSARKDMELRHRRRLESEGKVEGHRSFLPVWMQQMEEPTRTGFLATVLASQRFERVCLLVIIFNTLISVYQTDLTAITLSNELPRWVEIAELGCTTFFVAELLLKLWVHGFYFFTNPDWPWNWFDTSIVATAVMEIILTKFTRMTVDLTFARICRILKIQKTFRALKAVRFLTEFRLMVNCVLGSLLPLAWTSVLLFGFLTIFSLLFLQATTAYMIETPNIPPATLQVLEKHFGSMSGSMILLLMCVSGGEDWGKIYDTMADIGPVYAYVFLFFVVFFLMSFFNITTSLFVDQTLKLSRPDHETRMLDKWREDMKAANDLRVMISALDEDHSGMVTRDEWMRMASQPDVVAYFELADLEIKDANEFFDTVATMTGLQEIDIEHFVEGCMKVKGAASSIDLQVVLVNVRIMKSTIEELVLHMTGEWPRQSFGKSLSRSSH